MLVPAGNTVPTELRVARIFLCSKIEHMIKAQPDDTWKRKFEEFKWKKWDEGLEKECKEECQVILSSSPTAL